MKTSDVMRELEAHHTHERRELKETQQTSLEFVRKMCNAGLISDVEPDGPMPDDQLTMTCGHCGKVLTGPVYGDPDVFEQHRRVCTGVLT